MTACVLRGNEQDVPKPSLNHLREIYQFMTVLAIRVNPAFWLALYWRKHRASEATAMVTSPKELTRHGLILQPICTWPRDHSLYAFPCSSAA